MPRNQSEAGVQFPALPMQGAPLRQEATIYHLRAFLNEGTAGAYRYTDKGQIALIRYHQLCKTFTPEQERKYHSIHCELSDFYRNWWRNHG